MIKNMEIYVKNTETDKLVNITDLNRNDYEQFLEVVLLIQIAYTKAIHKHYTKSNTGRIAKLHSQLRTELRTKLKTKLK